MTSELDEPLEVEATRAHRVKRSVRFNDAPPLPMDLKVSTNLVERRGKLWQQGTVDPFMELFPSPLTYEESLIS